MTSSAQAVQQMPDLAHRPADMLEQRESADGILRILEHLPPRQQEILRLRFQAGLSYRQISEITELTVSNVGVLIHTAIRTLRQRAATHARG